MKFELHDTVEIVASGETGKVIGRAEFASASDSYLIRYRSADGRAVEEWWSEEALVPAKVAA